MCAQGIKARWQLTKLLANKLKNHKSSSHYITHWTFKQKKKRQYRNFVDTFNVVFLSSRAKSAFYVSVVVFFTVCANASWLRSRSCC